MTGTAMVDELVKSVESRKGFVEMGLAEGFIGRAGLGGPELR